MSCPPTKGKKCCKLNKPAILAFFQFVFCSKNMASIQKALLHTKQGYKAGVTYFFSGCLLHNTHSVRAKHSDKKSVCQYVS